MYMCVCVCVQLFLFNLICRNPESLVWECFFPGNKTLLLLEASRCDFLRTILTLSVSWLNRTLSRLAVPPCACLHACLHVCLCVLSHAGACLCAPPLDPQLHCWWRQLAPITLGFLSNFQLTALSSAFSALFPPAAPRGFPLFS